MEAIETENIKEQEFFGEDNDAYNIQKTEFLTTKQELQSIIKRTNNKKSEGRDGLSNYVLKKMPDRFCSVTTAIFNSCMQRGYFPKNRKMQ